MVRLQALAVPYECHKLLESGNVDARDVTDAAEVEYITLGKIEGGRDDLPPLPKEAFDVLLQFPKLRSIRLEFFLIDPADLKRLSEIPNLQEFAVHISRHGDCRSFRTPDDLDFLAGLPKLERLSLTSCELTDEMMPKLLPLKSLKRLRLSWNSGVTHASLPTFEKLPSLETLTMGYTGLAMSPMEARRLAARLKSFSYRPAPAIRNEKFTLDDFREIVTFPRRTWTYPHKTDVPLADLIPLLPTPLTRFSARSWDREMTLGGTDEDGERFSFCISRPLSDADLEAVGRIGTLREVKISMKPKSQISFTGDGLRQLTGLPGLEYLEIASPLRLTGDSLAALSKMPSLRRVVLRGIDLDANALAWLRRTPELERLTLLDGTIDGDALAELNHVKKLKDLTLGEIEPHGADFSVSITSPTRPLAVDTIKQLTLANSDLTVQQCRAVGQIRSIESLTINGPVTDAHLACLGSLERLTKLIVIPTTKWTRGKLVVAGEVTPRGVEQLRRTGTPMYLHVHSVSFPMEQVMADQFGWRFYGCSSGCCDTIPMGGDEWTVEAGHLKPKAPTPVNYSDDQTPRVVRLRGPLQVDQLVLDKQELPPTADTLCLTDCHVEELHFRGWLPTSIRIWGDSEVACMLATDVDADARTSLLYFFLQGVTRLNVPASSYLSHVQVTECSSLESLRLDGFYPNLEQLDLSGVEHLQYLAAPYRGDAPRLAYPANSYWAANLPALRLLKMPGTAVGNTSLLPNQNANSGERGEPLRFPPNLVEVDLRDTQINDAWLLCLAKLEHLKVVRMSECANLTEEGKAAFRRQRPDVELDEKTLHRPGM